MQDKQHQVLALLLKGVREVEIEKRCGVSSETIAHWKHHAAFQDLLSDKRLQQLADSRAFLDYLAGEALYELQQLLSSPSEEVRLSACRILLENAHLKNQQAQS